MQRKPNNWRRMHGYPLRRKGKGRKKRGRGGPYIFVDEVSMLFPLDSSFVAKITARARGYQGRDRQTSQVFRL